MYYFNVHHHRHLPRRHLFQAMEMALKPNNMVSKVDNNALQRQTLRGRSALASRGPFCQCMSKVYFHSYIYPTDLIWISDSYFR